MGTIAKFLFALQDTHNMGNSPSGSAGKEALSRTVSADRFGYKNPLASNIIDRDSGSAFVLLHAAPQWAFEMVRHNAASQARALR
jgi:hypothetical protein